MDNLQSIRKRKKHHVTGLNFLLSVAMSYTDNTMQRCFFMAYVVLYFGINGVSMSRGFITSSKYLASSTIIEKILDLNKALKRMTSQINHLFEIEKITITKASNNDYNIITNNLIDYEKKGRKVRLLISLRKAKIVVNLAVAR